MNGCWGLYGWLAYDLFWVGVGLCMVTVTVQAVLYTISAVFKYWWVDA